MIQGLFCDSNKCNYIFPLYKITLLKNCMVCPSHVIIYTQSGCLQRGDKLARCRIPNCKPIIILTKVHADYYRNHFRERGSQVPSPVHNPVETPSPESTPIIPHQLSPNHTTPQTTPTQITTARKIKTKSSPIPHGTGKTTFLFRYRESNPGLPGSKDS